MSIKVTSTTDSEETTVKAVGSVTEEVQEEQNESESDTQASDTDETLEASDASETDDAESDDDADEKAKDDTEGDDEDELEAKEEKPKKKSGFKKRIERFQRRLSEKEQEIEYWKREALKGKAQDKPETQQEVAPKLSEKPKPDDFETHEDYVEALTDWKIEQRELKRKAEDSQTQAKIQFQKSVETFQAKVKEFQKTHEDFDEVLAEVDDIPLSVAIQEALLSSDLGPNVMYELAKDREELERINALGVIAAAREIGKIEAQLKAKSSSTANQIKKITKAPPPISPVGSKSEKATRRSIYDADISQSEFERLREEQLKRLRSG